MTDAALFDSPEALRHAFESGLVDMAGRDVLGAFILALANAAYEPAMLSRMRPALSDAFGRWCARFDADDPLVADAARDDVDVFRRVRQLGFERLSATLWRVVGPWRLQYNQLRGLRPARMSDAFVDALQRPFDADGFHFNKPFLRREILWEGGLDGAPLRLLYNKFPFAELHGLLVPYPESCHAQYLSADMHELSWHLVDRLGRTLRGVGFGYNAPGAYASVNHLHLQMHVRDDRPYPIELVQWRHNGGDYEYPLPVTRFDDRDQAWRAIAKLHASGCAYNLLYRPGSVFVTPRQMQGSYRHSDWTGGFAWSEIAGLITLSDDAAFRRLSEADVMAEFARVRGV